MNNIRYDLSERLIHFFREVDLRSESPVSFPENWGLDHLVEDDLFTPLFLLRLAIRHSKLFATWAIRNSKRTIYGENPAICFTEMPLAAFIQTSKQRSSLGQAISSYGISLKKTDLFSIGARPVIYGLSCDSIRTSTTPKSERIIDENLLPLHEQYRYVTYNPVGNRKIDWTHEREWRWAYLDSIDAFEKEIEEFGIVGEIDNIPGLMINNKLIQELGVIVNTKEEAELVLCDILAEFDRQKWTPYSFVFYTQQISNISSILTPQQEQAEIQKSIIDLSPYIIPQKKRDDAIYSKFKEIIAIVESEFPNIESGELGGCWLWVYDSLNPFTRALINKERIEVNNQNKYLCFPFEFNDSRSLAQREEMTKVLAERLKTEFDIDCGYFSVLISDDYNEVPFYCSQNYEKYEDRLINKAF